MERHQPDAAMGFQGRILTFPWQAHPGKPGTSCKEQALTACPANPDRLVLHPGLSARSRTRDKPCNPAEHSLNRLTVVKSRHTALGDFALCRQFGQGGTNHRNGNPCCHRYLRIELLAVPLQMKKNGFSVHLDYLSEYGDRESAARIGHQKPALPDMKIDRKKAIPDK